MAVRFRCPCGAILVADEAHVDAVKPCPQCHQNLRIPAAPHPARTCTVCKQPVPSGHTIWVRGRRLCWNCMPPAAVRLDLGAFREHRKLQLDTIRKAKHQGLHHFQYHAPFEGLHSRLQAAADDAVFEERDWDRITPAWRELGLLPFDMGNFMGVSLSVERFRAQAEESKQYLEPLFELVKLSDELPTASIPKPVAPPSENTASTGPAPGA